MINNTNTVVEVRYLCRYFDYNENVFWFYILELLSLDQTKLCFGYLVLYHKSLILFTSCTSLVGQKT